MKTVDITIRHTITHWWFIHHMQKKKKKVLHAVCVRSSKCEFVLVNTMK